MTFKSIFAVAIVTASLAGLAGGAEAKTRVVLGLGGPFGWSDDCQRAGNHVYCFGPHVSNPHHFDDRNVYDGPHLSYRIDCREARSMVRERGYRKVITRDCDGKTYSFSASKNGQRFLVKVNAHTGRMKAYAL
ncbi:MAG: hypothetical protein GYA66_06660 [Phyllobacteriaceae bacterium]|nr:hypothetical protein [Phyllobacteriaceae bacterium]